MFPPLPKRPGYRLIKHWQRLWRSSDLLYTWTTREFTVPSPGVMVDGFGGHVRETADQFQFVPTAETCVSASP